MYKLYNLGIFALLGVLALSCAGKNGKNGAQGPPGTATSIYLISSLSCVRGAGKNGANLLSFTATSNDTTPGAVANCNVQCYDFMSDGENASVPLSTVFNLNPSESLQFSKNCDGSSCGSNHSVACALSCSTDFHSFGVDNQRVHCT